MGCFSDNKAMPVFPSMVVMNKIYSSFDTINLCQRLAAKYGATLYALQNGNECYYGPGNTTYRLHGASSDCSSVCGFDDSPHAFNCGGPSSNSVYQLSVYS